MRIKSHSDFWCGLIFVAIGVAFVVFARQYRLGSAARMGPAYFPTLLGGLLAVIGLGIAGAALVVDGARFPRLHVRPLLAILTAIVVFALVVDPLGFALAVVALVLIGGLADPDLHPMESIGVALLLALFSIGIFVALLGLPFNLWPTL